MNNIVEATHEEEEGNAPSRIITYGIHQFRFTPPSVGRKTHFGKLSCITDHGNGRIICNSSSVEKAIETIKSRYEPGITVAPTEDRRTGR